LKKFFVVLKIDKISGYKNVNLVLKGYSKHELDLLKVLKSITGMIKIITVKHKMKQL